MIKLKSILTELTQKERELKKDYLFQQSKLKSSNTFPTWSEMWKHIQTSRDSFDRMIKDFRDYSDEGKNMSEKEIMMAVEDEQRHRYWNVVEQYKRLDGEPCWREIVIPVKVDPRKLPQLGRYWAVIESSAESHWAKYTGEPSLTCTYRGVIDFHIVDWMGTMVARMDYVLGDDEHEIRFLKNAKIFVEDVIVYNNLRDGMNRYTIKQKRLT